MQNNGIRSICTHAYHCVFHIRTLVLVSFSFVSGLFPPPGKSPYAFMSYFLLYVHRCVLSSGLCIWEWMWRLSFTSTSLPSLIYHRPPFQIVSCIKTRVCIQKKKSDIFLSLAQNLFCFCFFNCLEFVSRHSCMPQCHHGGQRLTFKSQLFLSTMRVLGVEFTSLGLEANSFPRRFTSCPWSGFFSLTCFFFFHPFPCKWHNVTRPCWIDTLLFLSLLLHVP